jgi:hypothetical protein
MFVPSPPTGRENPEKYGLSFLFALVHMDVAWWW